MSLAVVAPVAADQVSLEWRRPRRCRSGRPMVLRACRQARSRLTAPLVFLAAGKEPGVELGVHVVAEVLFQCRGHIGWDGDNTSASFTHLQAVRRERRDPSCSSILLISRPHCRHGATRFEWLVKTAAEFSAALSGRTKGSGRKVTPPRVMWCLRLLAV
jgi:hypothetical protein